MTALIETIKANKVKTVLSLVAVAALVLLVVVSARVLGDDCGCEERSASKAIENFKDGSGVSGGDGEVPLGEVETTEAARLRRRLFNGNDISKHSLPTMSGAQQYEVLPRKPHYRMVGRPGSSVLPNQHSVLSN